MRGDEARGDGRDDLLREEAAPRLDERVVGRALLRGLLLLRLGEDPLLLLLRLLVRQRVGLDRFGRCLDLVIHRSAL